MPSKPSKHAQPDNFDTDDNDPQWDTSNMHLPKYHVALCETIDDDSTYTSLIEHGYVTHKGTHYFVTLFRKRHTLAHVDHLVDVCLSCRILRSMSPSHAVGDLAPTLSLRLVLAPTP